MNEDVCTVGYFHALCHSLAEDYRDRGGQIPDGLSLHDLGQGIKSLILRKLPSEYLEFGPTRNPLLSDGSFDFVKPVPYGVLVKAAKAAGIVSNSEPPDQKAATSAV